MGGDHCNGCALAGQGCASGGLDDDGFECPRQRNAPRTPAGIAAWQACAVAGVWLRAGMGGVIGGLDFGAAREAAVALGAEDGPALQQSLRAIEAGCLRAAKAQSKASAGDSDHE